MGAYDEEGRKQKHNFEKTPKEEQLVFNILSFILSYGLLTARHRMLFLSSLNIDAIECPLG